MRTVVSAMALCLSVIGLAVAENPSADTRRSTSILAQDLGAALQVLAKQRDFQIVCRADLVKDLRTRGVSGDLTADEALTQLLSGTGLAYRHLDDRTVTIVDASASSTQDAPSQRPDQPGNGSDEPSSSGEQPTGAQRESTVSTGLEEIVVTATRRAESIQNLPTSISALSDKDIERRNLVGMSDYLNTVPGVSINDMGAGRNSIVIRGIGVSEVDQNVTGTYLGEVPLTSLAFFGNADIKLVDMSRVEVLRGPQGTLYGAGAMGGAVRSIPAPPNPLDLEARVATTYSRTAELGGNNTSFEGMVNVPLLDGRLALRAVGYKFRNSGYYENRAASDPGASAMASAFGVPQLALDKRNVGNDEYVGGRLSVLWTPTDKLRATLTYLNQDLDQEGFPEADLGVGGGWSQARLQMPALRFGNVSSPGGADHLGDDLETTNLVLEYDLGWASIVSSTSWVEEFAVRNLDMTQAFEAPAFQLQGNEAQAFFQELRLSSQLDGRVQFIAGVFYEDIDKQRHITNQFSGEATLNPYGDVNLVGFVQEASKQQQALFGEVTYEMTDTLAATVGARFFEYEAADHFDNSGVLSGSDSHALAADEAQSSYKLNLTYKPAAGAMLYAQWAQGFRLGYPDQPFIPNGCDADQDGLIDGTDVSTGLSAVKSDFLDSYELGGKFRLLDNRLSLQAAVYQTDWRDMPVVSFFECNAEVVRNLGEARSRGAELAIAWQLRDKLEVELGASYTDAEVSKTVEALGEEGDRLPGSPRYSYNLGLQYDFAMGHLDSFIEWSLAYRGKLYAELAERGTAAGDYYLMNARWGVNVGKLNLAVFGNNLTNEDGLVWVSQVFNGRMYRVRPRTIGLELAYQF
jgi:iron complex outermembrane recepter protein